MARAAHAAGATSAAADDGKHSAKVTDWTDRIGWIVGLLLFVALVYWLMRQGWQWRRTLQGGLPELPQAPDRTAGAADGDGDPDPDAAAATGLDGEPPLTMEGRYHGSTTAEQWLDRIVAHGLGVRSKAALTLTDDGLRVERTGAPGFFIPAAALRGARLDRAIAGKVLPEGGLLVVTWEHGGTLIDSGFRSDHAAEHPRWVERLGALHAAHAVPAAPGAAGAPPAGEAAPAAGGAAPPAGDAVPHDVLHDKEGAR
ncbi:PH-like domain-containing protein [Actinacidiphila sp. DG2A-62]|uniref:PH-like domain-containing protein n=1 Tax=Actinacidiphila sp. DG2A-62 TaxID=3108821 RepID=UPI003FA35331